MPHDHDDDVRREYERVTRQLYHRGERPIEVETGPWPRPFEPNGPGNAPPVPLPGEQQHQQQPPNQHQQGGHSPAAVSPPPAAYTQPPYQHQPPNQHQQGGHSPAAVSPPPAAYTQPPHQQHTQPPHPQEPPQGYPQQPQQGYPQHHQQPGGPPAAAVGPPPPEQGDAPQQQHQGGYAPPQEPQHHQPQHQYHQPQYQYHPPQHQQHQEQLQQLETSILRIEEARNDEQNILETYQTGQAYDIALTGLMQRLFNEQEVLTFSQLYQFLEQLMPQTIMQWPYIIHSLYFVKKSEEVDDTNVWTGASQKTPTSCLCTPIDMVSRYFPFIHADGDTWLPGDLIQPFCVRDERTCSILKNMAGRWQLIPMQLKSANSTMPIPAVSSGVPPLILAGPTRKLLKYGKIYIDCITAITNKVEYFLRAQVLGRITDDVLTNVRDNAARLPIIRWNALTISDMKSLFEFIGNKEAGFGTDPVTANRIQEFIYYSVEPFLQAVNSTLERMSRLEKALGDALVYKNQQQVEKQRLRNDLHTCLRVVYDACSDDNRSDILAPLSQLLHAGDYMDTYIPRNDIHSAFMAVQTVLKQHRQTSFLLKDFADALETCTAQHDGNLTRFYDDHPVIKNAIPPIKTIKDSVDRLLEKRSNANANILQCIQALKSKGYAPRERNATESEYVVLMDQLRRVQGIDGSKSTVADDNMQSQNEEVRQLKEEIDRMQHTGDNLAQAATAFQTTVLSAIEDLARCVSTLESDEKRAEKIITFIQETKQDEVKQFLPVRTCEKLEEIANFVKTSFETRKREAASSLDKDKTIELLRKDVRSKTAELETVKKELAIKQNAESLYNKQLAAAKKAQAVVAELSHGKFTEVISRITGCLGQQAAEDPNDLFNPDPLLSIMRQYTGQYENVLQTMDSKEFPAQQQDSLLALTALHSRLQTVFRSADRVLRARAPNVQAAAGSEADLKQKENDAVPKAASEAAADTSVLLGAMSAQGDGVAERELAGKRDAQEELDRMYDMDAMLKETAAKLKRQKTGNNADTHPMQAHLKASSMIGLPPRERVFIIEARNNPPRTRLSPILRTHLNKIVYQIGLTKLVGDLLLSFSKVMATQHLVPGTDQPGPRAAIQTYEWTRTVTTNTLLFINKAWRTGQVKKLEQLMVEMHRLHSTLAATFKKAKGEELPALTEKDIQTNASIVRRVQKEINNMVKWYERWRSADVEDGGDEDPSLEDMDDGASDHKESQEEEEDDAHRAKEGHSDGVESEKGVESGDGGDIEEEEKSSDEEKAGAVTSKNKNKKKKKNNNKKKGR